jgi:hypothetical protein
VQLAHINVRAFVAVLGACPEPPREIPEVCSQKTRSIRLGSAHVTYIGHGAEAPAVDGTVESLVLTTGRPFADDRPFASGAVPPSDRLDGKYACLTVGPRRIEALTDCIGAGGVFYARQRDALYVSSHLGLLLRALPRVPSLNDVRIAAQLLGRAQLFDETHFDGTYRLVAGGRLVADLRPDGELDMRVIAGKGVMDLLDVDAPSLTPENFRMLLDSSVERERYGADSVLMLSGGRDSYFIALSSPPTPGRSVTYGESYSIDFVRARQRAGRLGLEFLAVPYETWTLETYQDEITALHAGFSGLQTAHNIVGFAWAGERAGLASVGYLGDVFRGKVLNKMDMGPHETTVLPVLLRKVIDPLLGEVFAKEKAIVVEYAMDSFHDLSRDVGPHKAMSLLKLQWQQGREFSLLFDLCDWFVPISYPFMHRRLLASWLQADLANTANRKVFDTALEDARAERGYVRDYRGGRPGRAWTRLLASAAALSRGRKVALRCDWQAVLRRSRTPFEKVVCSHDRLAELTERAWRRVLSGEDKSAVPTAYRASALVETVNKLSARGPDRSADIHQSNERPELQTLRV